MKNVLFTAFVAFFSMTTNAQLCSNCAVQQGQRQDTFTPAIFTPVPVGSVGTGVAYLKQAPTMTLPPLRAVAYLYLLDANGKIVEEGVSGEIINAPSDWNGTFYGDEHHKVTYPLAIPVTIRMNYVRTPDGKVAIDAAGNPIGQPEIFFFAPSFIR